VAFVNDTFTGTDGTLLTSHTGETGATWTKHPSVVTNGIGQIYSNRVTGNGELVYFYASGTPASADYDIEIDATDMGTGREAGLLGRVNTSAQTWYQFYGFGGYFYFYKYISGTPTLLGGPTAGTIGSHWKLSMVGSALKGYAGGTLLFSVTDSSITTAGKAGLLLDDAIATTGVHVDNFTATDAPAATTNKVTMLL
jgi:hypothetical protein